MWPACWYGGPYWNGQRMSNATCYYFRSEQAAKDEVEKLKKQK